MWDGLRTPFPRPVAPGETVEVDVLVDAPRPPWSLRPPLRPRRGAPLLALRGRRRDARRRGRRRAADRRATARRRRPRRPRPADGRPRSRPRRSRWSTSDAAATAHLVAGAEPGAGLVAAAPRRPRGGLGAPSAPRSSRPAGRSSAAGPRGRCGGWAPGGRNPRLDAPLLLPSLVAGLEAGAHRRASVLRRAKALFEGRAVVRLPTRSGRRPR